MGRGEFGLQRGAQFRIREAGPGWPTAIGRGILGLFARKKKEDGQRAVGSGYAFAYHIIEPIDDQSVSKRLRRPPLPSRDPGSSRVGLPQLNDRDRAGASDGGGSHRPRHPGRGFDRQGKKSAPLAD